MSLKKVNQESTVYSTQIYPPLEPLSLTMPQEELSRLWGQILSLKSDERQAVEDKFQVTLMFATMNQICQALTDFMTATERQLQIINNQQISQNTTMNERQLNLLSIQKGYAVEVKAQAYKIINESYAVIENKQEKIFEKMQSDLQKSVNKMVKSIDGSVDLCHKVTKHAKETGDKVFKFKTWWDLIWYASPIAVFLNLVFRVYQHFAGG